MGLRSATSAAAISLVAFYLRIGRRIEALCKRAAVSLHRFEAQHSHCGNFCTQVPVIWVSLVLEAMSLAIQTASLYHPYLLQDKCGPSC